LGVPLFQEQAMNVAIVGAGFSPAQADKLRRSMATFKSTGGVSKFREPMIAGMLKNGYTPDFAERTFKQIEGFGSYGFPESHAASFAKIAYASSWMKCHHPEIFCAALLNAQPMGFYQPAQIVQDAQKHGVEVRPVCINTSEWDCTLEPPDPPLQKQGRIEALLPLRLGLRMAAGLSKDDGEEILKARVAGLFRSVEDVWHRSGVSRLALEKLANADAFHALGLSRRQALWQVRGLREKPLPLFAAAGLLEAAREPAVALTPMTGGREVVEDYAAVQLSLRGHPLAFLRPELERRGIARCGDLIRMKDGRRVTVSGLVLIRQKPGKGNVTFITLEDETGIANAILWQRVFDAHRRIVMSASMIAASGLLQREGDVIHIVSEWIEDQSALLRTVGQRDFPHRFGPGDGAKGGFDPREKERAHGENHAPFHLDSAETIRVKSRNFH
jgi:error-prone DNA polymerase